MDEKDQILDRVSNEIISRVNPEWNKLQKMRFAYLELGKYLEKNTDFFLNEKLGALNDDEIKKIYEDDLIPVRNIPSYTEQYQIICKSAMLFLRVTLEKLGIDTLEVRTVKEENGIRHWFLAAKDDNDSYLFLTLAADLPFIKNNFPTEHFGTNIIYELNGEKYYDSEEEIPHRVLTKEELEELDKSIGYERLYPRLDTSQVNIDDDAYSYKYLFQTTQEESSDIYEIFRKYLKINEQEPKPIDDIKDTDFLLFLKELNKYVFTELKERLNLDINIDDDFENIMEIIINYIGNNNSISIDPELPLKKQVKQIRKNIDKKNNEGIELLDLISYLIKVNSSINDYVYLKDTYKEELSSITKKIKELELEDLTLENARILKNTIVEEQLRKKQLETLRRDVSIVELNEMLKRIAYFFIKDEIEVSSSEYVSQEYIANKLAIMFPLTFDTGYNEEKEQTVFSIQTYSEQIVVIKKLLKVIFKELGYENSKETIDYDDRYSPVENRIQTFPLKNKDTDEYCIGFNIVGKIDDEEIYFIYVPSSNNFRILNVLEEIDKYSIISNRFSEKLSELELDKLK